MNRHIIVPPENIRNVQSKITEKKRAGTRFFNQYAGEIIHQLEGDIHLHQVLEGYIPLIEDTSNKGDFWEYFHFFNWSLLYAAMTDNLPMFSVKRNTASEFKDSLTGAVHVDLEGLLPIGRRLKAENQSLEEFRGVLTSNAKAQLDSLSVFHLGMFTIYDLVDQAYIADPSIRNRGTKAYVKK